MTARPPMTCRWWCSNFPRMVMRENNAHSVYLIRSSLLRFLVGKLARRRPAPRTCKGRDPSQQLSALVVIPTGICLLRTGAHKRYFFPPSESVDRDATTPRCSIGSQLSNGRVKSVSRWMKSGSCSSVSATSLGLQNAGKSCPVESSRNSTV